MAFGKKKTAPLSPEAEAQQIQAREDRKSRPLFKKALPRFVTLLRRVRWNLIAATSSLALATLAPTMSMAIRGSSTPAGSAAWLILMKSSI